MESTEAIDIQVSTTGQYWLHTKSWDLTWISLSATLVALPFISYEIFNLILCYSSVQNFFQIKPQDIPDVSRNTVNAIIALLIGGPHMYSTFTRTFFDGKFRREHHALVLSSFIIPLFVVVMGIFQFRILVTFFFFWASLHIMEQAGYIVGCYNVKASRSDSRYSRMLDYIVVFTSLYPIGVWKMIHGQFKIGQIELILPGFIHVDQNPMIGYSFFILITVVFFSSMTLWLHKSYFEYKAGTLHRPKFLFILLTSVVAFFIPSYRELDVAFQGFNTWHSFQYLGLTWYINTRQKQLRGRFDSTLLNTISERGKGWKFYLFNVGIAFITIGVVSLFLATRHLTGFSFDQAYYIVILSILLMHYYQDHYLFKDFEAVI